MPAVGEDARARDLTNGRKKLAEFRARKAKRAASLAHAPLDENDATGTGTNGADASITYGARLEAKLAELGAVEEPVETNVALRAPTGADASPESARARPQVIDEDYGETLDAAAAAERRRAAAAALDDARREYESVNDAIEELGADTVAGDVAGELSREMASLREAFDAERDALRREIAELEDELRTARGALEDTNAIVAERAVEIDAVRGELAEKMEELRRATEDVEDARAGMEEMKTAIEESKRASKEKVKKAIAKGKSIESEKKALETEM